MATHTAVVMEATRAPLGIRQVPTVAPTGREVRVRVEWTASTPLDLHQADGGLLVQHPQSTGDGSAGVVVEAGPDATRLRVGDEVFGFTWRNAAEKAHQEYITAPEFLFGKLPPNIPPQAAVTLPNNFVTVFHAVTADLALPLPWPKPPGYTPPHADAPVLIWGGASSVGQFALQILRFYGYTRLLATASARHHALLASLGAARVFDYRDPDVARAVLDEAAAGEPAGAGRPRVPLILDCIGSAGGSLAPLARIAEPGTIVAVLLPVVVRDATEAAPPEYSMDVAGAVPWKEGVEARGVRTHFYLDNAFFAEHLQPDIMPALLADGTVRPNAQRIIDGPTLLSRAQAALDALRRKEASGERLVWRVAEA